MSYSYADHRAYCFTEEGQERLLKVLSAAQRHIKESGAVLAIKLLIGSGDSWEMMAIVDRLVELKKLRYFGSERTAWQDQVLVEGSAGIL